MTSDEVRTHLSAYLDGELDESTRRAVDAALASSVELRTELEALRRIVGLVRSLPCRRAPAGFARRVAEALQREAAAQPSAAVRPRVWRPIVLAAAAGILLCVGALLLTRGLAPRESAHVVRPPSAVEKESSPELPAKRLEAAKAVAEQKPASQANANAPGGGDEWHGAEKAHARDADRERAGQIAMAEKRQENGQGAAPRPAAAAPSPPVALVPAPAAQPPVAQAPARPAEPPTTPSTVPAAERPVGHAPVEPAKPDVPEQAPAKREPGPGKAEPEGKEGIVAYAAKAAEEAARPSPRAPVTAESGDTADSRLAGPKGGAPHGPLPQPEATLLADIARVRERKAAGASRAQALTGRGAGLPSFSAPSDAPRTREVELAYADLAPCIAEVRAALAAANVPYAIEPLGSGEFVVETTVAEGEAAALVARLRRVADEGRSRQSIEGEPRAGAAAPLVRPALPMPPPRGSAAGAAPSATLRGSSTERIRLVLRFRLAEPASRPAAPQE